MGETPPERPPGYVAGRHGADRPGADRNALDRMRPRRDDPETPADGTPAGAYAPARRPGGAGRQPGYDQSGYDQSGYDRPYRGRHGAGGDPTDRNGSGRHAAHGYAPGRHDADERDVDDRYALEAEDHTSARYDDTVEYESGRHGSRYREHGYDHGGPGPDDVEGFDPGYPDRGQPGYPSDEFGSGEYDPDGHDLDGYAADEYGYDPDDDRTARLPAAVGGTGRRRAPDDDDPDGPAAEGAGRESPRSHARSRRSEERSTRRRWPWVVGGVAVVAFVAIGLAVLGGPQEQRGTSSSGGVVGLGTSSGTGQPGVASGSGQPGTGQPGVAPTAAGAPPPAAAEVTYEVTGSGSAGTITFSRGTSVGQISDAELPWKKTTPAVDGPAEYTLTAAGGSDGMSCKISVGGAVVSEEKAGKFAAVSCTGRR